MSVNVKLENFVDEAIRRFRARGYNPIKFKRMRASDGTVEAIKKLVASGNKQSGFARIWEIGLLNWSMEAAILKFPDEFTIHEQNMARMRLKEAGLDPSTL